MLEATDTLRAVSISNTLAHLLMLLKAQYVLVKRLSFQVLLKRLATQSAPGPGDLSGITFQVVFLATGTFHSCSNNLVPQLILSCYCRSAGKQLLKLSRSITGATYSSQGLQQA